MCKICVKKVQYWVADYWYDGFEFTCFSFSSLTRWLELCSELLKADYSCHDSTDWIIFSLWKYYYCNTAFSKQLVKNKMRSFAVSTCISFLSDGTKESALAFMLNRGLANEALW